MELDQFVQELEKMFAPKPQIAPTQRFNPLQRIIGPRPVGPLAPATGITSDNLFGGASLPPNTEQNTKPVNPAADFPFLEAEARKLNKKTNKEIV